MAQNNTRYPNGIEAGARILDGVVATTKTTAGAVTYTAAEFAGGLILRDPNGAGRTDITPTAALLDAQLGTPRVGSALVVTIRNTADAAETITMSGGTGVTISGTATIAQNNQKAFLCVKTATTPTYTIYSLGTVVF
jgi:hypothetical protein